MKDLKRATIDVTQGKSLDYGKFIYPVVLKHENGFSKSTTTPETRWSIEFEWHPVEDFIELIDCPCGGPKGHVPNGLNCRKL